MHILVAEANADMRETIKSVLSALPATFHQCGNGRRAVREYLRLKPDWVLMDIHMPELDGLRATEIIKAFDPTAKVVLIADYDDTAFRAEAVRLRTDGYVLKENLIDVRRIIT